MLTNNCYNYNYCFHHAVPDGPPQMLTAKTDSITSVTVSWKPPKRELQNGPIVGYHLWYTSNPSQLMSAWRSLSVTMNTTLLDGLQPGVNYTIAVAASTSVGYGPSDQIVFATVNLRKLNFTLFFILL